MKVVRIHEHGGPEVVRVDEVQEPTPGAGEVLLQVEAAGVNYLDTMRRRGDREIPLPATLGFEAAGTVAAVGPDVQGVAVGDRVAYGDPRVPGSYAEAVVVPADSLAPVPDPLSSPQAAATMAQGMTAHYLADSAFPLEPRHTALVLAAAGGVGHLLVQLARARGARVIATTSTHEKAELVRSLGADDVILYRDEDLVEATMRLTAGRGVDVVYDSIGRETFTRSLECLVPRGVLVWYGQASGAVEPFDPRLLQPRSLWVTRTGMAHYAAEPEDIRRRAGELFDWILAGRLQVRVDRTWPLAQAAEAHRYMEAGATRGKLLLLPT